MKYPDCQNLSLNDGEPNGAQKLPWTTPELTRLPLQQTRSGLIIDILEDFLEDFFPDVFGS